MTIKIKLIRPPTNTVDEKYKRLLKAEKRRNKKYADKGFKVEYFETSAKTNENVSVAFEHLGSKIIDYIQFRKDQRGKSS